MHMVCWFEKLKAMNRIIVTLPGPLYDCDTSWDSSIIIMTLPGLTLRLWHFLGHLYDCVVALPWVHLWLQHFLGHLDDCDTSWGLSMTDMFWALLYDCDSSWASLWLWNFLWAYLWLWHFLGPLYYFDTSWSLLVIEITLHWLFSS